MPPNPPDTEACRAVAAEVFVGHRPNRLEVALHDALRADVIQLPALFIWPYIIRPLRRVRESNPSSPTRRRDSNAQSGPRRIFVCAKKPTGLPIARAVSRRFSIHEATAQSRRTIPSARGLACAAITIKSSGSSATSRPGCSSGSAGCFLMPAFAMSWAPRGARMFLVVMSDGVCSHSVVSVAVRDRLNVSDHRAVGE